MRKNQKMTDEQKASISGAGNHAWKGGKPKCKSCTNLVSDYHVKECNSCFHKRRVGVSHPRWISDRSKVKADRVHAYDSAYKTWMRHVKNRDGWKCKIANGDCSGRVEAHHILGWKDHPELRYQINNGIALCHAHHPKKRAEEKRLSPYFQELVSVSSD